MKSPFGAKVVSHGFTPFGGGPLQFQLWKWGKSKAQSFILAFGKLSDLSACSECVKWVPLQQRFSLLAATLVICLLLSAPRSLLNPVLNWLSQLTALTAPMQQHGPAFIKPTPFHVRSHTLQHQKSKMIWQKLDTSEMRKWKNMSPFIGIIARYPSTHLFHILKTGSLRSNGFHA